MAADAERARRAGRAEKAAAGLCAEAHSLSLHAAIEEPAVIARILTHSGLPARDPTRAPEASWRRGRSSLAPYSRAEILLH